MFKKAAHCSLSSKMQKSSLFLCRFFFKPGERERGNAGTKRKARHAAQLHFELALNFHKRQMPSARTPYSLKHSQRAHNNNTAKSTSRSAFIKHQVTKIPASALKGRRLLSAGYLEHNIFPQPNPFPPQ
jgi:hypothetical protein